MTDRAFDRLKEEALKWYYAWQKVLVGNEQDNKNERSSNGRREERE